MSDHLTELLAGLGLDPEATNGGVAVTLPSERRGSFTMFLRATERGVLMRAFVMRNPDRLHEAVYHRLLRWNFGSRPWRYCLNEDDDVFLAAELPADAVTSEGLDGMLGAACAAVDDVFEGIVRVGFDIPEGVSLRPPDQEI